MMTELPTLDASPPTTRALDAAESVLLGFYHQDLRETHLSNCEFDAARAAAESAEAHMSRAFRFEFPDAPAARADRAGELFMRALFVQDEIENQESFTQCFTHEVPDDVFVSDVEAMVQTSIDDDARWADCERLLEAACDEVGIDPEYATLHVRFWRMHGQKREGWRAAARRAHRIKLACMVPAADTDTIETLAQYFVAGAERHDEWARRDVHQEVGSALDIVATYYQAIFDLRDR
ncbi:hypothetical protein C453_10740 [Haloferax elongans ATCC BAA-1513]|uniref:Uncharacterized protein n=1 Tax=Haloferax elongans ATCC BAA-1513 TaxID=1230453 RepID=M0HN01_HALEO|nr:hypothetical protein [Haloferax elongans]ELZ85052.1 hypothetical protein C453_10740 [Haloferax elongans ATCC BAA-1513]